MRLKPLFSSRRLLLGGLAASLGLASTAVPLLTDTVSADPVDDAHTSNVLAPDTLPTYESCTADFGLTKETANLATFDVVDNTAGPAPTVSSTWLAGPTLVPVITLTDGSNTVVECAPQLGWTDQATWLSDYVTPMGANFTQNVLTYPGTDFWLLPAFDGSTTLWYNDGNSTTPFLPVSATLRFESNITVTPISWTMHTLPTTPARVYGWNVWATPTTITDSYWTTALGYVTAAGTAAQSAYLQSAIEASVNSTPFCDLQTGQPLVPDANFTPLLATLDTLTGPGWTTTQCDQLVTAAGWLYNDAVQVAKAQVPPVVITLGDPPPPTTIAPEPVTPSFTG